MGTISTAELEACSIEAVPSRETLSLVNIGNIANITAVNLALAINVGSGSAWAQANQLTTSWQYWH